MLTTSEAFLSVKFLTFRNPNGHKENGYCCDGTRSLCTSECDHSFTICLDQIDEHLTDINHCTYGKFVSKSISDENYINFYHRIADIENPLVWRLSIWPGQVRLKVDVFDVDTKDVPDRVIYLHKDISLVPVNSKQGSRFILEEKKKELTLEARVFCGRDYYNMDCSIYCQPRNSLFGHYLCDPGNGTKTCFTGWTGENCAINKNDCAGITCQNGGICKDLLNMFECKCLQGFEGRFCEEEINECLNPDVCRHGNCVNIPGSFTCTCFEGYTGNACRTDIDECLDSPCQNGALCIDQVGNFKCSCPAGYTGNVCDTDVDECQLHPCRNNGTCKNLVGTYTCHCLSGYQGNDCSLDVNECDDELCMMKGRCANHFGGFTCHCSEGFEGLHCETDINECQVLRMACQNQGTCMNTNGSYTCSCHKGYTGSVCEQDEDECLYKPCQHAGRCHNLYGTYLCQCRDGYAGANCENNINECLDNVCKHSGTCLDQDGRFLCTCSPFWKGETCEKDIDECISNPCRHGGTCKNFEGGFICECLNEFIGDLCEEDRNECELATFCKNNSTCVNSVGNFSCDCTSGWTGLKCDENIHECKGYICSNMGTCVNRDDDFYCECLVNWTGQRCEVEINECNLSVNPCRNNAVCRNTSGVFTCDCTNGWTGSLCDEDLNECETHLDICTIFDSSKCNSSSTTSTSTFTNTICFNTQPGYMCICDKGWAGLCCNQDIDECQENPLICSSGDIFSEHSVNNSAIRTELHAVCINRKPGYQCVCAEGWTGQNCDVYMYKDKIDITSSSTHLPDDLFSTSILPGNTQSFDCLTTDCLVPDGLDHSNMVQKYATQEVSHNLDSNTSHFPPLINSTPAILEIESNLSLPFNLNCRIDPDKQWILDKSLRQYFHDIGTFLGQELAVSHKTEIWKSKNGEDMTSVIPIIEVDGKFLNVSEVTHAISQGAQIFSSYFDCSSFLNIRGNFSFPAASSNSSSQSWSPGVISSCCLLLVLVVSIIVFKCWRKIKMQGKRIFKVREVEIRRSFRNETYQKKSEDAQQKSEDITSVTKPAIKPQKCLLCPKSSSTQVRCPVKKYANVVNTNNKYTGTCAAISCQHKQISSKTHINISSHPRIQNEDNTELKAEICTSNVSGLSQDINQNEDNTELKAEIYTSNVSGLSQDINQNEDNTELKAEICTSNVSGLSQDINQNSEKQRMTKDVECDKYMSLPFIDDPESTEIFKMNRD